MPTSLLVLWDIDHTLIQTGGVGSEVFKAAYKAATGADLENPPDPTGKLEPALFAAACKANGIGVSAELFAAFASAPVEAYRARAEDMRSHGRVLPGVSAVLGILKDQPGVTQTVLSGNTLASGQAKLQIFGLPEYIDFECAVGGEDAPTRPELVPVAWDRVRSVRRRSFGPADTVLIGDTAADVDAARRNECHIVAVATGKTTAAELREAGAELVLPDLSDPQAALDAISGFASAS